MPAGVQVAQSAIANAVTIPLPLLTRLERSPVLLALQSSRVGSSARAATMPVTACHTPVRCRSALACLDHTGSS